MSKKTISIKEYADAKGVTTQSIYKNIKNENPFIMKYVVTKEDGKKELKAEILDTIIEEENKEEVKAESVKTESASSGKEENNYNTEYVEFLKSQIEFFMKELEKKDTQIDILNQMLVKEQQLTSQAQANLFLVAGGSKSKKPETVETEGEEKEEEKKENAIEISETGAKTQKKKSLFWFWHK